MTVLVTNLISRKAAATSETVQYTASNTVVIDKFTITNVSTAVVSFSCYLPAINEEFSNGNKVLDNYLVSPDETYICPELVGQVLLSGGTIVTIAGAANAITISSAGRSGV